MLLGLGRIILRKIKKPVIHFRQLFFSFLVPFTIFYILSYLSLLPSFASDANLLRWIGNNDILNYINITHYLSHLGASNVVGHSYIEHASYAATPGVFYGFSFFSLFYNGNTMTAAMPMLFTCMALIGLMIYRYCHRIFELSWLISISIAAVIIFGGFYHYIQGNYFLSTLFVTAPLIYLLTETIKLDYSHSSSYKSLFCLTLPSLILIFFFYPVILFCTFIIQWGLIGLKIVCSCNNFSAQTTKIALKSFLKCTAILFVCLLLVFISNPANFISFLKTLADFANMTGGGWGLPLISPFAILGVPSKMALHSIYAQIPILLAFFILIIICTAGVLRLKKAGELHTSAIVFFIFSVVSIMVYLLYYYHLGPTRYQPWKFASYYALPFAGGIWAMFSRVLQSKDIAYSWNKITVTLVSLAIIGNIFIVWKATPPFQTLSNKYQRLNAIDQMDVSDVWVKMADYSSTFLPVYFIPHKKLHLLSDSYYPMQSLKMAHIGPRQPLFIETTDKCIGTAPDKVIKLSHLGCLYLTMPTLEFNQTIKFNTDPLFIQTTGFSNSESWGKWSSKNDASFTLYSQLAVLKQHPNGYIKIKVKPFLYPDIKGQHVKISWGKKSTISLFIKKEQWISLPYSMQDWKNVSTSKVLQQLTVSMKLSDALPANQLDPESSDERSLGVGLVALKLTL